MRVAISTNTLNSGFKDWDLVSVTSFDELYERDLAAPSDPWSLRLRDCQLSPSSAYYLSADVVHSFPHLRPRVWVDNGTVPFHISRADELYLSVSTRFVAPLESSALKVFTSLMTGLRSSIDL